MSVQTWIITLILMSLATLALLIPVLDCFDANKSEQAQEPLPSRMWQEIDEIMERAWKDA